MKKIIQLIIIPAAVFNTNPVVAQQDSTFSKNLEEVIVTGQYKPQSLKNQFTRYG